MNKDWLSEQLSAGRSIETIAREVGKDPSTVGYWVRKHRLVSLHPSVTPTAGRSTAAAWRNSSLAA